MIMKDAKSYDPNVDKAGFAEVYIGRQVEQVKNGGEGSGNFGHEGRPGEVGGSGPGGGGSHSFEKAGKKVTLSGTRTRSDNARRNAEIKMDVNGKEGWVSDVYESKQSPTGYIMSVNPYADATKELAGKQKADRIAIDKQTFDFAKGELDRATSERVKEESAKPLTTWEASEGGYGILNDPSPTGVDAVWHEEATGIQKDIASLKDREKSVFRSEIEKHSTRTGGSVGEGTRTITHDDLKSALAVAKGSQKPAPESSPEAKAREKFAYDVDVMESGKGYADSSRGMSGPLHKWG